MQDAFTRKGLDQPRLMAEMLLAHVLSCERLRLYMDPDRPANLAERSRLRELAARAMAHEPVQYLTGEAWFFGMPLVVDRRVLIPRQCTGVLIERARAHSRVEPGFGGEGVLIADIGTGSGNITAALLKQMPQARALATDISPEALAVASMNLERTGVRDRAELLEGDLLEPVIGHPAVGRTPESGLHYLVSNPPYIPDHEWEAVEANVKNHEPHVALRGGADGLDLVRPLLEQGPDLLRPRGMIAVEVAAVTAEEASRILAGHAAIERVDVLADQDGLPRVVVGLRRAEV